MIRSTRTFMTTDFDYWNIDSVLAEDERVKTMFTQGALNLGWLDQSTGSPNLEVGCKVELPLWLAVRLKQSQAVNVALPRYLALPIRTAVMSDPCQFDLRNLCPYFYEVAAHMLVLLPRLTMPAATDLYPATVYIFIKRAADIMDRAAASRDEGERLIPAENSARN